MADERLSPYLEHVLGVFRDHLRGVMVDAYGEPDPEAVVRLAALLGDDPADVRNALLGLRQCDCLIEEELRFAGVEELGRWSVHPQCLDGARRLRVEIL